MNDDEVSGKLTMKRYYVYIVKTDNPNERINAFVEDPEIFASEKFDSNTMEFSGVFVEAETANMAYEIYISPKEGDVFVSCDEPEATLFKRRFHESHRKIQEQNIVRLRMSTLIAEIAISLTDFSTKVSELTRLLRSVAPEAERELFSNEEIYERLMQAYGIQFAQLRYRFSKSGE